MAGAVLAVELGTGAYLEDGSHLIQVVGRLGSSLVVEDCSLPCYCPEGLRVVTVSDLLAGPWRRVPRKVGA